MFPVYEPVPNDSPINRIVPLSEEEFVSDTSEDIDGNINVTISKYMENLTIFPSDQDSEHDNLEFESQEQEIFYDDIYEDLQTDKSTMGMFPNTLNIDALASDAVDSISEPFKWLFKGS